MSKPPTSKHGRRPANSEPTIEITVNEFRASLAPLARVMMRAEFEPGDYLLRYQLGWPWREVQRLNDPDTPHNLARRQLLTDLGLWNAEQGREYLLHEYVSLGVDAKAENAPDTTTKNRAEYMTKMDEFDRLWQPIGEQSLAISFKPVKLEAAPKIDSALVRYESKMKQADRESLIAQGIQTGGLTGAEASALYWLFEE